MPGFDSKPVKPVVEKLSGVTLTSFHAFDISVAYFRIDCIFSFSVRRFLWNEYLPLPLFSFPCEDIEEMK